MARLSTLEGKGREGGREGRNGRRVKGEREGICGMYVVGMHVHIIK